MTAQGPGDHASLGSRVEGRKAWSAAWGCGSKLCPRNPDINSHRQHWVGTGGLGLPSTGCMWPLAGTASSALVGEEKEEGKEEEEEEEQMEK